MRVLRGKGANTVSEAKTSQNGRRTGAKLSESDVRQIKERYHRGERPSDIAADFPQVSKSTVRIICHGLAWRDIVVAAEEP
jgi:hypothetical protein